RLYAYNVNATSGATLLQSQSNCTLSGNSVGVQGFGTTVARPFLCGITPGLINPVSMNTITTDATRSFLNSTTGRIVSPKEGVQGYGLRRIGHHAHTTADYKISDDLTASVLAGYNREVWSTLIDLDGFDSKSITQVGTTAYPTGYDFPYLIERKTADWSVEGRLAYNHGPLRGLVGVSYLDALQYAGGGGVGTVVPGGKSENRTIGAFFGLTYNFTSQLSLSLEGRYQSDDLAAYARTGGQTIAGSAFIPAGYYPGGSKLAAATYNNFTPRVIVNYQITPATMVYASFAKGVNPAQFNANILAQAATVQAAAQAAGAELAIKPEKVTNWELGIKGKALNNKLRYTAAAYYAQWRNEINALTIVAPDSTQATGYSFVTGSANSGSVDLYGVEAELTYRVSPLITIDAAGAMNATDIKQFKNTTLSQLTGIYDFSGKEMKNTSKYSGNIGITFGGGVVGMRDSKWFWRTDWNYKSGMWSNEANLVRSPDLHLFNTRAGISKGKVSVDVFVNNVFNNHTYTSISDNYTFPVGLAAYSAVLVGLPDLRTFGLQAKLKF
ncbi:MAG TPA: TonB-dependent receptor, partial [Novosphingobium sp.]|nr:TonB-dependent receptor [Novosphingobium sp.]